MNTKLREYKNTIRAYMHDHYTDANLIDLLDSARQSFLAYDTCCCFIGLPSRDHDGFGTHDKRLSCHGALYVRGENPAAEPAEDAFLRLMHWSPVALVTTADFDAARRRILIPMILAELKRRRTLETQPVPTSCWECSERIEDGVHDCVYRGKV